jgi:hypothetical protein
VHVRFGGEGLVLLDNHGLASYPTRVTGEPLKPDAATRNAERPKGEKRQLASRLPGNSYGRFARRAEGKGPRERYLASRLSYLGYLFEKKALWTGVARLFLSVRWNTAIDPEGNHSRSSKKTPE